MKKEAIFIGVWCALSYLTLFLFHRFSLAVNSYIGKSFDFNLLYLNKFGVPFLGFIVLGFYLGVLAINIKYFTKIGHIVILTYALYLVLKYPIAFITQSFIFIYPDWMYMTIYEISTHFGGLIIMVIIINLWKSKFMFLGRN